MREEDFLDRRMRPRIHSKLVANIESRDMAGKILQKGQGKVTNLSALGVSIQLPFSLSQGQSVHLEISFDDDFPVFRTAGYVQWSRENGSTEWDYGVLFSGVTPAERSVLSKWLAEQFKTNGYLLDRRQKEQIISARIEFRNRSGRRVLGYIDQDKTLAGHSDVPMIILPPAYGETKTNAITASYFMAANGMRVLRYDATDHVGESDGDMLQCRMRTLVGDLHSAVDYAVQEFGVKHVGLLAASLGGRVAVKAASEDPRIAALATIVGVVDLRSTLKAVYNEDMIGTCMEGRQWGVTEILGFSVEGAFLETAISDNFHNLSSTIADIKSTQGRIIQFVAENDFWVKSEDVKKAQSGNCEMIFIPGSLHQMYENRSIAKMVLRMAAQKLLQNLTKEAPTLESIKAPSFREIGFQVRAERERSYHLNATNGDDTHGFWEKYLEGFDFVLRSKDFQEMYRLIAQLIEPMDGHSILDAGCGNGNFAVTLLEYLYGSRQKRLSGNKRSGNVDYIGIDYVESALNAARKRIAEGQIKCEKLGFKPQMHCAFVVGDANKVLPFCKDQFSISVCNLLLSYVEDPVFTLREQNRLLKKRGLIVLTSLKLNPDLSILFHEFTKQSSGKELEEARKLLSNAGGIRFREMEGSFRFFSAEELQKLLFATGFINIRSYPTLANQGIMVIGEKA